MKNVSFLLTFLLLLQSCSVYNKPATVEEAVFADSKVKIVTANKQKYRFLRLTNENNILFGTAKLGSPTAKKLAGRPAQINENYLKVDLSGVDIEKVTLYNKKGSTNLTIIAVAASIIVAAVAIFIISFASAEWNFGKGPQ